MVSTSDDDDDETMSAKKSLPPFPFEMNLRRPKSVYSPNGWQDEDGLYSWDCAWCSACYTDNTHPDEYDQRDIPKGYLSWEKGDDGEYHYVVLSDVQEYEDDVDALTIYEGVCEYSGRKKSSYNVETALKYLKWCWRCNQFSGGCCRPTVPHCTRSDRYTKLISSVTWNGREIVGSPIVPLSHMTEFIELALSGEMVINEWCPCPGFCPHGLWSDAKGTDLYDVDHETQHYCCSKNLVPVPAPNGYSGFSRWTDELKKIGRGKIKKQIIQWAKSNLVRWPHSQEVYKHASDDREPDEYRRFSYQDEDE